MRLPDRSSAWGLLLVGAILAAGNVWVALSRSTIPYRLDGIAEDKEHWLEKNPGFDDVCVVKLKGGTWITVDRPVYKAIEPGRRVFKERWSRTILIDDRPVTVGLSQDTRNMLGLMPVIVAGFAGLTWWMRRTPKKSIVDQAPHS